MMNKYNCIQQLTSDRDKEALRNVANNFTQFLHDEAFEMGKDHKALNQTNSGLMKIKL